MNLACGTFKLLTSRNGLYCFPYLVRNVSKWSEPLEIRIPNYYGHIAAKGWGKQHHEPVLALHGWQDNAGTFDRLIPLLSQDLYIVAIDAPGHGLSSHMPLGTFYQPMQDLLEIKRIADHMKWEQFSLIGHSSGGEMAILFSSIFPDRVKNVVLIDAAKPMSSEPEELADYTRKNIEHLLKLENKLSTEPPVYSLEEARKKLMHRHNFEITEIGADTLLKRGSLLSKCGKGVVFSRDIRLKISPFMQPISSVNLKKYLQNVRCNLLIILSDETPEIFRPHSPEEFDEFISSYKATCRSFKLVEINGNHFVHLDNPERVAPLINDFFNKNVRCKSP